MRRLGSRWVGCGVAAALLVLSGVSPSVVVAAEGPALVGAATGGRVRGGHLSIPRPAGTSPGDVLIAGVAEHEVGELTPPQGWTLVRHDFVPRDIWFWVWYRVAGPAEPESYVWTVADRAANGAVLVYRGVDAGNPVVASAGSALGRSRTKGIPLPPVDVGAVAGTQLVAFTAIEGPTPNKVAPPLGFRKITERAVHPSTASADMAFAGTGVAGPFEARPKSGKEKYGRVGVLLALRPAA